ncbi:MAG: sulfite exporter TauE/SafE family protein [Gloeomargaritaceae cyanobacterium C42_A2020_066]|nr:sulfite exporter TauE/SafE family protein [Gloeomargaritaceae cyanobacterium C42_A2020_066]
MTYLIGHLLSVGIGVSLGLLGGGGSVLALPVLVYVMGIPPKPAVAMTLIMVGTVSAVSALSQARRGNVNLRMVAIFGSTTMLGAYLGARLAAQPWVTATVQMTVFGLAMLGAASLMIIRTARPESGNRPQPPGVSAGDFYYQPVCKYCWLWLMTEGLGIGVLTGLVGVGGGFALVPALVLLGKVPLRAAMGTSLAIIAGNSAAGLLGYLNTVPLDGHLIVTFTLAAGLGALVGGELAERISVRALQKGFGYFLLAIAAFVLLKNALPAPSNQSRGQDSAFRPTGVTQPSGSAGRPLRG